MNAALIGAAAAASFGVWFWILRRYDRLRPEPLLLLLRVGLLGGGIAVLLAGVANNLVPALLDIPEEPETVLGMAALALIVGFNEELLKAWVTIRAVRRLPEFDEPADGLIYAMTVALGFAAIENLEYMALHGVGVILLRSVLSVPGHMAYAALSGYGIARVRFVEGREPSLSGIFPWLGAAMLAHGAYDFFLFLGDFWTFLVACALDLVLIDRARRRLNAMAAPSV
jgi:RsiW-degrading membrane proteinase PrsW (M82 family)